MFAQENKTFANYRQTFFSKLAGVMPFMTKQKSIRVENGQTRPQQQTNITINQVQGSTEVSILRLRGALNKNCYLDLIAKTEELYRAGTRHLIFDMSDIPSVGISSLVALHSIAVILRGETPLDPQQGWETLRAVSHDLAEGGLQPQFKLFNPQPEVKQTLEQAGFVGFLEMHTDLEAMIGSFCN